MTTEGLWFCFIDFSFWQLIYFKLQCDVIIIYLVYKLSRDSSYPFNCLSIDTRYKSFQTTYSNTLLYLYVSLSTKPLVFRDFVVVLLLLLLWFLRINPHLFREGTQLKFSVKLGTLSDPHDGIPPPLPRPPCPLGLVGVGDGLLTAEGLYCPPFRGLSTAPLPTASHYTVTIV